MSRNGYTNDDTWMVAAACDNTEGFEQLYAPIQARTAAGDIAGAAAALKELVVEKGAVQHLHESIDFDSVGWAEIVTTWAEDAA